MPIGDTIQPAVPTGVGGNGVNRELLCRRLSKHRLTNYTREQVEASAWEADQEEAQAALALFMSATPVESATPVD